ncbi:MAG: guanylate kinase [Gammaproteobacteria bacterium]|nr:guanylate kinase [Gammaproteobacteria bacterium]
MSEPGNLYVISAPSGTGKTTLVKALVESIPGITVSISHTTRPKRPAEMHGVNYYFIEEAEFQQLVEHNDFLEHATVFDRHYGTSRRWVEDTLRRGIDVILEIDWQGAKQIQDLFPNSISVFILPPSVSDLYQRLIKRNQDNIEIIKQRITDVRESTNHLGDYDYMVINDDFSAALSDLKIIVESGRLIQRRQSIKFSKLIKELSTAKVDEF